MTDTVGSVTGRAKDTAGSAGNGAKETPLGGLAHSPAVDHLKSEAQEYLAAQAQRLLTGAGRKLGEATVKLNDIADGNSPGLGKLALDGGRKLAEGKGPLRSALELGAGRAKESVTGALKNLGGGKGKKNGKGRSGHKPTVIMESVDVGVPLRTAYDQWTQYQTFSTFAKGVKSAQRDDDTHSDWNAKIWWSSRSWKATTREQLPDDRISWTSEGAKGTTKGVVSFHSLGENLTRVLLVIEYYPSGFFEKTGNIWRAQGRRVRLDLKHFARFITLRGEAEDSWRGEIRDAEVVRSHEDVVAEEESEEEETEASGREESGEEGDEYEEPEAYEEGEEEYEEPEEYEEGEEYEGDEEVPEDEVPEDEVPEDEVPEDAAEEDYEEEEDEDRAAAGGSRR
ncbi:SRPBCC family protein [Streptomyces sp. NPDC046862]|uniref:SRPBCC family protein n=1 Tax=Streptomyces sp. NPDC046862 TaxID=3154603 RepID=UPI0034559DE2